MKTIIHTPCWIPYFTMESNSWGIYEAFGTLALAHHWALPFRQRRVRFRPNCFRQVCFHPAPDRRPPLDRRPHCTSSCLWQHKCQTRGCCWWCFALLLLLKACLNPTSPGHIKHGKTMSWRRITSKTTFTRMGPCMVSSGILKTGQACRKKESHGNLTLHISSLFG